MSNNSCWNSLALKTLTLGDRSCKLNLTLSRSNHSEFRVYETLTLLLHRLFVYILTTEVHRMASTTTTAPVAAPSATTTKTAAPATSSNPEQLTLSTIELQLLSEIDSQQFGFLKLNDESNVQKRAVITKAIKYLEKFIVRARERQRRAQVIFLVVRQSADRQSGKFI